MRLKRIFAVLFAVALCFAFSACGDNGGGDASTDGGDTAATTGTAPSSIKIGIPNPTTGPIASFGIGTPWAENLAVDLINADGGIYIEEYDTKIPIELIVVDTESNSTKASEVTQQLIEQNDVDMLIARHTPDTALPVSAMGERYGVPTVSLECPVNPWLQGGPYEWVYHSFWRVETNFELFRSMWTKLGYGEGTVIGFMFPNDPDGLAWYDIFKDMCDQYGYVISDPGRYPIMNQDWTSVISQFKADGVQIITGCDIAPDFASFASQAAQQGLEYDLVTMGRAFLYPADANANPVEIAEGLTCEVWWSPWHPYTSSLTGMTCAEMAAQYEDEFGIEWSAPMGYKYAGVEIAIDALKRAASLDPVKIRDAIGATNLDTIVGHIEYDPETHVAETPIVGGQWKLNEAGDAVEIMIVENDSNPQIPTNATLELPKR
ncbi:MAG: ABC transporter substrate-binding protein [Clostridiales Family XIII bacterium]|jgi:branched-chain amino acid transport system substrate-binding protein|nr:ABC transporter substrate-binding protein [Clostridiales Family XIII bacterium]